MFDNSFLNQNQLFNNPFSNNNKSEDPLAEAYRKLELLKNQQLGQQPQQQVERNVFSDIAEQYKGISEDEKIFIENSKEYIEASQKYQEAFNSFLIEHLGKDFIKSKHCLAAENLLTVIKHKKDSYRNKFAEDISSIKSANSKLERNNEELIKANLILQKQLEEIQKKIK